MSYEYYNAGHEWVEDGNYSTIQCQASNIGDLGVQEAILRGTLRVFPCYITVILFLFYVHRNVPSSRHALLSGFIFC